MVLVFARVNTKTGLRGLYPKEKKSIGDYM